MRALALIAALAAGPAFADTLSCNLTRACIQGGACAKAAVPLVVRDAAGPRPVMEVDGVAHPVDREFNFYGTVYHGWNSDLLGVGHPGELWVRSNGRTRYVRRASVRGVTIRTDYRGRCNIVPDAGVAGAAVGAEPIK